MEAKSRGCARFWVAKVDYAAEPPYWRTCPLDKLIVPDERDPLYREIWGQRT